MTPYIEGKIVAGIPVRDLLEIINKKIEVLYDRDHQIGHSYFLKIEEDNVEDLRFVWYHEIIPLLQEYFYDDWSKIEEIIGHEFINKTKASDIVKNNNLNIDPDKEIYKIKHINDSQEFIKALSKWYERHKQRTAGKIEDAGKGT